MKKRLCCVLLLCCLCVSLLPAPALAAGAPSVRVVVDGNPVVFSGAQPFLENGRTVAPLSGGVFEALGVSVTWDEAAGEAVFSREDDGMTAVPISRDGQLFVPLRAVCEEFDALVTWDQATRTVLIHMPTDRVIPITNKDILRVMRYDIPERLPITEKIVARVKSLTLAIRDDADLSDLKHLRWLKELTIVNETGRPLKNAQVLHELPNLRRLTLDAPSAEGLLLSRLTALEELELRNFIPSSPAQLIPAPRLTALGLPIDKTPWLADFPGKAQIKNVWLYTYSGCDADLSVLTQFPNMDRLTLDAGSASHPELLSKLTKLKRLWMEISEPCDGLLPALAPLTGLEELSVLSAGVVKDLRFLQNKPNLRKLLLDAEEIRSANGLTSPALEHLCLRSEQEGAVLNLNFTAGMTHLKTLVMPRCGLWNMAALADKAELVYLDLGENHLSDLAALKDKPALEILDLRFNALAGRVVLPELPSLTFLNLDDNEITSLGGLENAPRLKDFSAAYNYLPPPADDKPLTWPDFLSEAERKQIAAAALDAAFAQDKWQPGDPPPVLEAGLVLKSWFPLDAKTEKARAALCLTGKECRTRAYRGEGSYRYTFDSCEAVNETEILLDLSSLPTLFPGGCWPAWEFIFKKTDGVWQITETRKGGICIDGDKWQPYDDIFPYYPYSL